MTINGHESSRKHTRLLTLIYIRVRGGIWGGNTRSLVTGAEKNTVKVCHIDLGCSRGPVYSRCLLLVDDHLILPVERATVQGTGMNFFFLTIFSEKESCLNSQTHLKEQNRSEIVNSMKMVPLC